MQERMASKKETSPLPWCDQYQSTGKKGLKSVPRYDADRQYGWYIKRADITGPAAKIGHGRSTVKKLGISKRIIELR